MGRLCFFPTHFFLQQFQTKLRQKLDGNGQLTNLAGEADYGRSDDPSDPFVFPFVFPFVGFTLKSCFGGFIHIATRGKTHTISFLSGK